MKSAALADASLSHTRGVISDSQVLATPWDTAARKALRPWTVIMSPGVGWPVANDEQTSQTGPSCGTSAAAFVS